MSSPRALPTSMQPRWKLNIRAQRAFSAISALNTAVATGVVMGTRPKTTPAGLAISVTRRSRSLLIMPRPISPLRVIDGEARKHVLARLVGNIADLGLLHGRAR